jgi:hypothetical protein
MSEYQYYEFRAIDRPLTPKQIEKLERLSSRAEITATSFTNTYNYGDFRGDPNALMKDDFDAHLYVANWGTHRLMFRLPRELVDVEAIEAYRGEEGLQITKHKNVVVLEFCSQDEEGGGWEEGEGQLDGLIALRADLLNGDLRSLYLGWLACVHAGEFDDDLDAKEPPLPAGFPKLTAPLKALAEFLRLDADLLRVATAKGSGSAPAGPSDRDLERWVAALPAADKDAFLLRLMVEEPSHPGLELLRRFRADQARTRPPKAAASAAPTRTVGDLLAAVEKGREAIRRRETEAAERERALAAKRKEEARTRQLDELARREGQVWGEVESLIPTKRPKDYDRAVTLLGDLRDLARHRNDLARFQDHLAELRTQHASKSSFLARLKKAGL